MTAVKLIAGLIGVFVITPIWFFLVYKILQSVDASELMWFLYWVYVPLGIFIQVIINIAENTRD